MCDRLRISICGVLALALAGAALAALPDGFAGQYLGDEAGECQGTSVPEPADGSVLGTATYFGCDGYCDIYHIILDYAPCAEAVLHTGYFSDNEQDIIDRDPAHSLGNPRWPEFSDTAFVVRYDDGCYPHYVCPPLALTTYYWCVDTFDGEQTVPGPTWSFTLIDEKAWSPSPADGEQRFRYQGTMTWNLGDVDVDGRALSYNVYMGTDRAAVSDANTASPEYATNVVPESYDYSIHHGGAEHFWRVDTRLTLTRPPFTPTIIRGDVWSFTISETNGPYMTDFNYDGITDFNDYAVLANDWPKTGSNLPGDTNGNYAVNHHDLRLLAANWLLSLGSINFMVADGMRYHIETDKTAYGLGENVCITYRVTNETHLSPSGPREVTFTFGCVPGYDFVVDQSGREIWRSSDDDPVCFIPWSFSLAPAEQREFFECWSMVNKQDNPVGPGLYTVSESGTTPGGISVNVRIKGP